MENLFDSVVQQEERPCAIVLGQPLNTLPKDLYIPPNALEVVLETFSGPLDLLLYLIKKENINILDIPIAKITEQYMQYVELMKHFQLEMAADYLVMAAVLMEIKSRMLLPKLPSEVLEEDPRAELVQRLREYELIKKAAEDIDALPRMDRDNFEVVVDLPDNKRPIKVPDIALNELVLAMRNVMCRVSMYQHHKVSREVMSIRERMSQVLDKLQSQSFLDFHTMFNYKTEGKQGVVVTFIVVLELLKQAMIELTQVEPFGPIYLKAKAR
jgi:segregation and condensation protein A